jgi:Zn-finger nucleic acid-binding protein
MKRMDAGHLSCPSCGAAADANAVRCDHCKVQLQTAACPRCFGFNFIGARHCSRCGAQLFAPAAATAPGDGARPCPRCKTALTLFAVGDVFLEECGRCGGLWVDVGSFQKVVTRHEQRAAFVGLGAPGVVAPRAATDTTGYIRCPECGTLMNRVNFARCSGVIVDVCKPHGTWFDADELQRILAFIAEGGLERARQREREREEIEAERKRLHEGQVRAQLGGDRFTQPAPTRATLVLDAAGELLAWLLR